MTELQVATMTYSQKATNLGKGIARTSAVLRQVLTEECGQDLIEYALVAALVGLGAVASMKSLSTKIGTAFGTIGTSVTSNV